ncbi:hypothetical protein HDG37_007355 [Paraburkholderia sp. MM5384-R2]|nr:hypothetical protein [Paraburkholderia sp. MM5384-R2]
MNTLLQRLVGRARGGPGAAALRIEPLLSPRYAMAHGAGGAAHPHEIHEGAIEPPRVRPATFEAAPTSTMPPREAVQGPEPACTVAIAPAGAPVVTLEARHASAGAVSTNLPAPAQREVSPSAAVREASESASLRLHDSIPHTPTEPLPVSPVIEHDRVAARAEDAPDGSIHIAAMRPCKPSRLTPTTDAAHPPPVTSDALAARDSSTQTITLSIGHVEVRSAPAAARQPAFRPGVSLDAFLRRRGNDER